MFEIVLYNQCRCELDRRRGSALPVLFAEQAAECLFRGGDEIHIIDLTDLAKEGVLDRIAAEGFDS